MKFTDCIRDVRSHIDAARYVLKQTMVSSILQGLLSMVPYFLAISWKIYPAPSKRMIKMTWNTIPASLDGSTYN